MQCMIIPLQVVIVSCTIFAHRTGIKAIIGVDLELRLFLWIRDYARMDDTEKEITGLLDIDKEKILTIDTESHLSIDKDDDFSISLFLTARPKSKKQIDQVMVLGFVKKGNGPEGSYSKYMSLLGHRYEFEVPTPQTTVTTTSFCLSAKRINRDLYFGNSHFFGSRCESRRCSRFGLYSLITCHNICFMQSS